ncbi:hypothetical protein H696_01776 [Fonticula alba]|uniref:Large ribosomal subunit protein mL50 n=1 Tax=Fonticula alba TaxID=691883 RepID=A0A058ZD92_FONAL|nr:hypothetical protein H696_01776 [Fonticula alba]KCV72380.1 hypothetical protein H696_01776 [Fonticula alba]|eukprot:XP_009493958.1 hypothetical protein H696_01776 [Fonticula alba]
MLSRSVGLVRVASARPLLRTLSRPFSSAATPPGAAVGFDEDYVDEPPTEEEPAPAKAGFVKSPLTRRQPAASAGAWYAELLEVSPLVAPSVDPADMYLDQAAALAQKESITAWVKGKIAEVGMAHGVSDGSLGDRESKFKVLAELEKGFGFRVPNHILTSVASMDDVAAFYTPVLTSPIQSALVPTATSDMIDIPANLIFTTSVRRKSDDN